LDWIGLGRGKWQMVCMFGVQLDHALATTEGCNMFPMTSLKHLTVVKSDHCPILLSTEREERCTSTFAKR
jgi:hypothetical protein